MGQILQTGISEGNIDVSKLAAGQYYLTISDGKGVSSAVFLKI